MKLSFLFGLFLFAGLVVYINGDRKEEKTGNLQTRTYIADQDWDGEADLVETYGPSVHRFGYAYRSRIPTEKEKQSFKESR